MVRTWKAPHRMVVVYEHNMPEILLCKHDTVAHRIRNCSGGRYHAASVKNMASNGGNREEWLRRRRE